MLDLTRDLIRDIARRGRAKRRGRKVVPTIRQVLEFFPKAAQIERMKNGKPCRDTVNNALNGAAVVLDAAGIGLSEPVTSITRRRLDLALAVLLGKGTKRITAITYMWQLRAVFAKWCKPYFDDNGWKVSCIDFPSLRPLCSRYERPSSDIRKSIKEWYGRQRGCKWFAVTMMLEFAMRNGDVKRLTERNFVEHDGRVYLSYVPHKTANTSGRRVCWPVHRAIWKKIRQLGGVERLKTTYKTFPSINRDLRKIGLRGGQGAYELRKMCIDHVYERFGAEMAVSISGDDIKTISRYYADVARPNIGNVRILDII